MTRAMATDIWDTRSEWPAVQGDFASMVRASVVIVLQLRSFNSSTKVPTCSAM